MIQVSILARLAANSTKLSAHTFYHGRRSKPRQPRIQSPSPPGPLQCNGQIFGSLDVVLPFLPCTTRRREAFGPPSMGERTWQWSRRAPLSSERHLDRIVMFKGPSLHNYTSLDRDVHCKSELMPPCDIDVKSVHPFILSPDHNALGKALAMSLPRGRLVVVALSIVWSIVTVWQEYLQFKLDGSHCDWPDHNFKSPTEGSELKPQHVLIVADPQILDHRSYPGRGTILTYLSQLIVDLNLRKNWWVAISKKPDVVMFIGDMMDGGRFDMSEAEYEGYYQRFKRIFKLDSAIPQYFIPGNHDTGLGYSKTFSPYSNLRYITHFGDKNYVLNLANHTLVFIDAPGFVDEEYKRLGLAKTYENWKPLSGGTLEFMKKFRKDEYRDPVILFTHIPLYRPDGRGCGPLRERGTIRPGVGNGYQNTLAKQSSYKILELVQPSLIFSGDDHDYCEHHHTPPTPRFQPGQRSQQGVREVTVKSLSMAMGIKRPGFQLLSLAPFELRIPTDESLSPNLLSHADTPCLLPDQLGSYLHVYIPLLIISLIIVTLPHFVTLRSRPTFKSDFASDDMRELTRSRPTFRLMPSNSRPRRDSSETPSNGNGSLPPPVPGTPDKSSLTYGISMLPRYLAGFFAPRPRGRGRPLGRFMSCLYDIRDIAVYPIGIFIFITLWFSY